MTRKYELTVLISPDLIEEEAFEIQKQLTSFIQEKEGEIIGSSNPSKRLLGYEIKNNIEAYIAEIRFSFDPKLIAELERKIKEKKEIIRHMVLIKEPETKKRERRSASLKPAAVKPSDQTKKFALGDIDKKIDEILNE